MNIKAKLGSLDIIIVAFVHAFSRDIQVVYTYGDGKLNYCYIDDSKLKIVDPMYLIGNAVK